MSEQPTLSTSGSNGFFSPRRVARVAILVALSGVGAFIKIPSPTGTVALDAAPGYLAAVAFSPLEGGVVGALGHLISAATAGFPLGLPIHLIIAAEMFVFAWLFGLLARPLGWGAYLLALGISVLGPVARAPQWVLDLSPFTHVPHLPVPEAGASGGVRLLLGSGGPWVGPAVCLVLAVVLLLVAGAAGNRRDLTA